MRPALLFAALVALALSACSEPPPAKVEEAPAAALAAGQWDVVREVTSFTKMDDGTASIPAKVGDKATVSVCVAADKTAAPPPELLTGLEDSGCTSDSLYLSRGRINASLACQPKGLPGKMYVTSTGTFTADTFDLAISRATQLPGSGDVRIAEKLTGRRTGECTAAVAK